MLLFLFIQNVNAASNKHDIDKLLEDANTTRSSNPTKYSVLLKQLSSQQQNMSSQQAYYFDYLTAYQFIYNGKVKIATLKLEKLLTSEAEVLIKLRARLTLVNVFAIEQNWAKGLSLLSVVLKQLPKINNNDTKINAIAVAAIFYNQIGQYNLGLNYAQELINRSSKERTLCMALTMTIESKYHLNLLKNDTSKALKVIDYCKHEPIAANFIRSYKARYDLANDNVENVITSLTPYLKEVEATKYPRLIVEVYIALAQAYLMQENLTKANSFALKTTKIGEGIKTTQAVVLAYKLLYQVALKQKQYRQALTYHEQYAKLDKANLDETKAKHLAFQLAEHQSFEQKSKIKLLNKKNSLLTMEQALAKAKVANIQLIIVILTVTLVLLIVWSGRFLKTHKRIKELATYDALTGVYNRGHFTQLAKSAIKHCKKAEQDLSIIMFDLDHFKLVNDNYGHACGDWALKETIKVCQSIGRKNDIFARLGGEEFCLLLPSCDIKAATLRAEACRVAIEEIMTEASGFNFSLSASFGVTDVKTSSFELDKLLADADSAAYESKHAGRNRVTVFKPNVSKEAQEEKPLDNSWNITS